MVQELVQWFGGSISRSVEVEKNHSTRVGASFPTSMLTGTTATASVTGAGMGTPRTTTIYGRVDPTTFPTDLAAGAHSDALTVTIKF
jgi:hypothetical protein